MSAVLQDLWPSDVISDEIVSPEAILRFQAQCLTDRSQGTLVGRENVLVGEDRIVLGFEVDAPPLRSTVKLFSAQHQSDLVYPVAITPPESKLPAYLQRRVYVPGRDPIGMSTAQLLADFAGKPGQWKENRWVAATPSEFTDRVKEILDSNEVKSVILSLLARSREAVNATESKSGVQTEGSSGT